MLSVPSTHGMESGMRMVIEGREFWIKRVVDGQVVELWPDPEGAIVRQGNRRKLPMWAILAIFLGILVLVEVLISLEFPL